MANAVDANEVQAGLPKAAFGIAGTLRERIVRGELAPGDPLPIESVLIDQFGASKSIVREALRILETEGLVEIRRGVGGGPRVTHPSILSISQAVGVHLQLGEVPVLDVLYAHAGMVTLAIETIANDPEDDAIDALGAVIDALEETIGARSEYSAAMTEVGEEFVRQAGNATHRLLISALRQIIVSEYATADAQLEHVETEFQTWLVKRLRTVVRHIAAGRAETARRCYLRMTDRMAVGMQQLLPDATVVDIFPWRMP